MQSAKKVNVYASVSQFISTLSEVVVIVIVLEETETAEEVVVKSREYSTAR